MRKRRDGTATRSPDRRKLTELYVRKVKPEPRLFCTLDTFQRGLALRVLPTGHKSWKAVYRHHSRPRWFHIGNAGAIPLSDARGIAVDGEWLRDSFLFACRQDAEAYLYYLKRRWDGFYAH